MNIMYFYIFLQSNLLEVPFYHFFFRQKSSWLKSLSLTTAINSLTHPIVFFIIMNLKNTYLSNILLAESFAVVTEAIFFYYVLRFSFKKSFSASLIANLVSWQFAPMLTYFIFSP